MTSIVNSTKEEILALATRNHEQSLRSDPVLLSKHLSVCRAEVKQAEEEYDRAVARKSKAGKMEAFAAALAHEERAFEARSKAWMAMLAQLDDAKTFEAIGRAACLDAARHWNDTPYFFEGLFARMELQLADAGHDVGRWQELIKESLLSHGSG
jgi:hypothetical protein